MFRLIVGIFITIIFAALPRHVLAMTEIKQSFPRLANYYLAWTISDEEAVQLAKWDFLILDPEVLHRTPQAVEKIRRLNPKIVILAYLPLAQIRADWPELQKNSPTRYKLGSQIFEGWYLKNANGERRTSWPGTWILNVTDKAPVINGERWNDLIVRFAAEEILKNSAWDGIFFDDSWDNISYYANGPPDLDLDGQNETKQEADELWRAGLRKIYQQVNFLNQKLPKPKLIFENDGPFYSAEVDGVLKENFFSKKDWPTFARDLRRIVQESRQNVAILNANTENKNEPQNYQAMRYGLATALLFNSFYSFDQGDQTHQQTWWYDEYNISLGLPLNLARRLNGSREIQRDLWRRDFQNGAVFLNSTGKIRNLILDEEYEKIIGIQDRSVNQGGLVSEIGLPPYDGIILRRPLHELEDISFSNGAFTRVFDFKGQAVRAGFFSYNADYEPGQILAKADLDRDGKKEIISENNGQLRLIYGAGGKIVKFAPFGKNFSGHLNFAFGDINGDGRQEIIVSQKDNGQGEVRVYRGNGELLVLPWRAFGSRYQGGVNLAVGDLNGDGKSEVIVGAGAGGGPQVRVFSFDGKLLSAGFFAYDPRSRGGVRVAAGDLNNDGEDEIITGPGPGNLPQIRIFNNKGKMAWAGFLAFDARNKNGIFPAVADLDGDGKMEVVAMMGQ